jgi:hypothetical protein
MVIPELRVCATRDSGLVTRGGAGTGTDTRRSSEGCEWNADGFTRHEAPRGAEFVHIRKCFLICSE